MMLGTLAALPDIASLALGSGTTASMTARESYKEWRTARENIESNQMYFYYDTRERLVAASSAPASTPGLPLRTECGRQTSEVKPEGARMDAPETDIEREAREFIEENEPLLNEGGISTLQKVFVQGAPITTDLSAEAVETANELAAATNALAEAIRNPATRPRKTFELEREIDRLKPIYERKKRAFDDFSALVERVKAAYEQKGGKL